MGIRDTTRQLAGYHTTETLFHPLISLEGAHFDALLVEQGLILEDMSSNPFWSHKGFNESSFTIDANFCQTFGTF